MSYTLAGPDIGVRRFDLGDLMIELGDDTAVDAVYELKKTPVYEIPNRQPRRILREYKAGDESLGFDYFARQVSRQPPPEAAPAPEPEAKTQDQEHGERPNQADARVFDVRPQDLLDLHSDGRLNLFRAVTHIKIEGVVGIYVRANDPDHAAEVLRKYQINEPFAEGEGVMFDPTQALALLGAVLRSEGSFDEAGWEFLSTKIATMAEADMKKLIDHLAAVEFAQFRKETADNVDKFMGWMGLGRP